MKQVSIRALKNRLDHYLRLVRAGHSLQVTERGEVVAELLPPAQRPAKDNTQPRSGETARLSLVPNDPRVYKLLPRLTPPGTAKRLLDAERGNR